MCCLSAKCERKTSRDVHIATWMGGFYSIDRFQSRGQQLSKLLAIKESFNMWKEFNSLRIFLVPEHGRRFIVLNTNMAAVTSRENKACSTPNNMVQQRTRFILTPCQYCWKNTEFDSARKWSEDGMGKTSFSLSSVCLTLKVMTDIWEGGGARTLMHLSIFFFNQRITLVAT